MKAAICTGQYPVVWKWVSAVVGPKPGKDNYRTLMVYHPISRLSRMGKEVEKVVTELLLEEAKRRGLCSDEQFRSRMGYSAIDIAAIMVDRAHAA
jgi:hypothetical protein